MARAAPSSLLCSNVSVDRESTGIVVGQKITVTTSPPDFRPGLLCFDGKGSPERSTSMHAGGVVKWVCAHVE